MKEGVAIVGAGVVGLSLAKELAKTGINVDVYDSKGDVKQGAAKASGIFSVEGLARTGIQYKGAVVNALDGAKIHAGGELFSVSSRSTKAYVLDRGIFAEICADEAARAGASIVLGDRVTRERVLELKKDYRVVVGADGAVSTVASACGFPPVNEYVLTYKAEYEDAVIEDAHKVELFFSKGLTTRFFGWTVPYSGSKLEVGIGISNRKGASSYTAFRRLLTNPDIKSMLKGAKMSAGYASIIPIDARKKTVIGNSLLVGDAAGQVKATTGGGIIFGVSCAGIAAKCIKKYIDNGIGLGAYEEEWRKAFGLDLRLHKMLHSYYSALGEKRFKLMMKSAKLMGFENFLGAYGDMDRPSLILKRILFRGSI